MAETNTTTKAVLSLCATTADRVKDLVIKNGQLIFCHDVGRLAFDYNGKRTFYNQVIEIEAEHDRINLENPINGKYYFVIETCIFWRYFNGWQQLTHNVKDIVFIGTDNFPTLGQSKTLYVNKKEKEISVWDDSKSGYITVANYCDSISPEEIIDFFK